MPSARDLVDNLSSHLNGSFQDLESEFSCCRSLLDFIHQNNSLIPAIENDQTTLNKLLYYIFERRYGWSDSVGKSYMESLSS